jgi:uncharacterized protein (DUF305 family)
MSTRRTSLILLVGGIACRSTGGDSPPPILQPGAPGESSRVITLQKAVEPPEVQHAAADVAFMQGMIGHHAQAIEMVELLDSRTGRDEMRLLGRRIALSQEDEIQMMQGWLTVRGQRLPDPHAHHAPGARLMPGMLTAEEMARLARAKGAEFDRLFLELMVKHHMGALVMVEELFENPGAGQDSEIFAFVSDVVADQRMEIERMAAMLKEIQK